MTCMPCPRITTLLLSPCARIALALIQSGAWQAHLPRWQHPFATRGQGACRLVVDEPRVPASCEGPDERMKTWLCCTNIDSFWFAVDAEEERRAHAARCLVGRERGTVGARFSDQVRWWECEKGAQRGSHLTPSGGTGDGLGAAAGRSGRARARDAQSAQIPGQGCREEGRGLWPWRWLAW